jgi:hypothetical protein
LLYAFPPLDRRSRGTQAFYQTRIVHYWLIGTQRRRTADREADRQDKNQTKRKQ